MSLSPSCGRLHRPMGRRGRKPKGRSVPPSPEDVRALFAHRLRELREQRGWTQAEMAAACGLSKVFYGVLELSKKSASLETLARIATGLRLPLEELLRLDSPASAKAPAQEETEAERLCRRLSAMAKAANEVQIRRLERVAKILLEPEGVESKKKTKRPRSRPGAAET